MSEQEGKEVSATRLLGEITWLMMQSDTHRYIFVVDLERLIKPAIQTGQFKIYRNQKGQPIGYVSWAFLSPEVEERFMTVPDQLRPSDWKTGPQPWIIDFLAPFGGTKQFVEDLRINVFPKDTVNSLRPAEDGFGFRKAVWRGVQAGQQIREKQKTEA